MDLLSLSSLLSDSEGTAVCEIVHTKSESEGRPERTFQLCCRYCFIGVFILCNYKHLFETCELKVNDTEHKIICIFLCFCPICSSPDSKKDFLKAVHSILREKQRRQLLKTEPLPLNQQYVPFGGKRLCALKGARPSMNRAGGKAGIQYSF